MRTVQPLRGMPDGGSKHSGQVKDPSMDGLEDYTRIRRVTTNLAG